MLWSGFLLGLLGSLHCIGMCGPIAFMLPIDRSHKTRQFLQIVSYHVGRLTAYSIIGLVFGLIGKSLDLFGIQQQLSVVIGILMISLMFVPASRLGATTVSKPMFQLISKVKSSLGHALKKNSPDALLTIGFLNGFLPCGMVYMAVFASIGMSSIGQGSLYMLLFGLGTIPLMTSAIYLGHFVSATLKKRIRHIVPAVVVLIGFLFILRGLGLGIPYLSPAPVNQVVTSHIECH